MALADPREALGMPLAFERFKADFTGIADPPDLRERLDIGAVFHEAFVKVDEKGTEAAAATAIAMAAGGGPWPQAAGHVRRRWATAEARRVPRGPSLQLRDRRQTYGPRSIRRARGGSDDEVDGAGSTSI